MSDPVILRGPSDLVASVPALLGFHPEASLVVLWLDASSCVSCTVRLDLDTPQVEVERRLHAVAGHLGAGAVVLVAYPRSLAGWIDSADEDRLLALAEALPGAGIAVLDVLIVCEGRYWSAQCVDPSCCPIGGRPLPGPATVLQAELVHHGVPAAAAGRGEVLARYRARPDLAPDEEQLATARDGLPEDLGERCDRVLELLTGSVETPAGSGAAAELMWLLQEVHVRDWALAHLCLDGPDPAGVEVLVQLARTAPERLRARLAGAAAAALYAGAQSSVAIWAMLDHAGQDSLARLVAASLDSCLPPAALREAISDALPVLEDRRRGQASA
jgi:hypothetical protein